jgi:hypothetical protein
MCKEIYQNWSKTRVYGNGLHKNTKNIALKPIKNTVMRKALPSLEIGIFGF